MRLDAVGGLEPDAVLGSLAAHTVPGAEQTDVEARTHSRLISGPRGPRRVFLRLDEGGIDLEVEADHGVEAPLPVGPDELLALSDIVRAWFDLDTDLDPVHRALGTDPLLAPLMASRPDLRVIGTPDRFQSAVTTVLGQQVSLAAGRTFAGRLVSAYGAPAAGGLRRFPEAQSLAEVGAEELRAVVGLTGARARTVLSLAQAWLASEDSSGTATREELLAVPGIGPWTVDYLAVRFGDRDAFAPGDLVLRRALGGITAKQASERAEAWRPYRAYALMHLWTHTAYARRGVSPAQPVP
ncbi:DNA-3-methyladenine glycosylase family protein [Sinomonas terrae]|uniref:DNA-3-methyladenine glycosylase II n=1 Tax=Sinomonas terrae TaxID=2908838 RepID=A0ABS9U678_9MICC|nr:AlkA N-terminal domain-containing protein [Sinomonas terrae]MCH6471775.1 3-methyladenine DNA glycosylase 2 [Sinomonas terrae]